MAEWAIIFLLSLFMAVMIATTKLRSISNSVIVISITPIPRTITAYRYVVLSISIILCIYIIVKQTLDKRIIIWYIINKESTAVNGCPQCKVIEITALLGIRAIISFYYWLIEWLKQQRSRYKACSVVLLTNPTFQEVHLR